MAVGNANCKCKECGKSFIVSRRCANRTDANNFEKYAEVMYDVCPECYKKQQIELRKQRIAKETEMLKEKTAEIELPELSGSEKQIAWANTIRAKYVCTALQLNKLRTPLLDWIRSKLKAAWWIDNRYYSLQMLVNNYNDEVNEYIEKNKEKQKGA